MNTAFVKALSLLLVLVMCLSLLPLSAFAEEAAAGNDMSAAAGWTVKI